MGAASSAVLSMASMEVEKDWWKPGSGIKLQPAQRANKTTTDKRIRLVFFIISPLSDNRSKECNCNQYTILVRTRQYGDARWGIKEIKKAEINIVSK